MKEKGQSLIEALVALGAAVIVISAITIAVVSALNNVEYTKNQNLATQYAQQALDIMRQISQSNWVLLSTYSGAYCFGQGDKVLSDTNRPPSCTKPNLGIFFREVDISQNSVSCNGGIMVTAIVSWSDGKCNLGNPYCHNVTLNSCFSNINNTVELP